MIFTLRKWTFLRGVGYGLTAAGAILLLGRTLAMFSDTAAGIVAGNLAADAVAFGAVIALAAACRVERTARYIDRKFNLANRWESAWGLRKSSSTIRNLQIRQTKAAWAAVPRLRRMRLLLPLLFGAATLIASAMIPAPRPSNITAEPPTVASQNQPESESETAAAPELKAALELVYPENDAKIKPLDLLEWEGKLSAEVEWSNISLTIWLNDTELAPVEVAPDGLAVIGELLPDQLGAAPYDVITLRLSGTAANTAASARVSSAPRFISIKPLRDEIDILEAGGGSDAQDDFILSINAALAAQKQLLGLFVEWSNQSAAAPEQSGQWRSLLKELAAEQEKLAVPLAAIANEERAMEMPTMPLPVLVSLENAISEMNAAAKAMTAMDAAEPPESVTRHQQLAIAHLNDILRNIRKIMRRDMETRPPPTPAAAEKKVQTNVLIQLNKAIELQKNVIDNFGAERKLSDELTPAQSAVTAILAVLKPRAELSDKVQVLLASAYNASSLAEAAILGRAENALETKTAAALRDMTTAKKLLEQNSAMATENAIGGARASAAAAGRELRKNNAEQAASQLRAAAQKLRETADRLNNDGKSEDAQKLRRLADAMASGERQMGENTSPETREEALKAIRDQLRAASGSGGDSGALAQKLSDLADESGVLSRDDSGFEQWFNETTAALDDASDLLADRAGGSAAAEAVQTVSELQQLTAAPWSPGEPLPFDFIKIEEKMKKLSAVIAPAKRSVKNIPAEMNLPGWDDPPDAYREAVKLYFEKLSNRRLK